MDERGIILADVDDVCLDWIGGFKKFLDAKGIKVHTQRPVNWDLSKWVDHHSALELVQEFNASADFTNLNPMEGALKHLLLLKEDFQLIAITACGVEFAEARKENLKRVFGEDTFIDVICLPLGASKLETLKAFPQGSWWIEDKIENASDGARLGLRAILFDRPYNGSPAHPQVKRVQGWEEAYKIIME